MESLEVKAAIVSVLVLMHVKFPGISDKERENDVPEKGNL
jgi:hypothetical protein